MTRAVTFISVFLCLLAFLGCSGGDENRMLKYEPEVNVVSGILKFVKHGHRNGTISEAFVLKLDRPASIIAGHSEYEPFINGVKEIHLVAKDKEVFHELKISDNQHVKVKGTIFYGHTAWHMRELVMNVVSMK